MRYFASILTVSALAILATADDAKKYTSKKRKFSVTFPAGADVTIDLTKSDTEAADAVVAKLPDGHIVAGVYRLPASGDGDRVDEKAVFAANEKAGVDRGVWVIHDSKDFTVGTDKLPGRKLLMERKKEGTWANTRLVISGRRMYYLSANGTKEFVNSKEAIACLDSFEITK
jgi:hypothetical protein